MARVLLVEDELASLAQLKRALSRGGYAVHAVTNGRDALSAIASEIPDVVLLSSSLQNDPLPQLLDQLRALGPTIPVLILGEAPGTGEPVFPRPVDSVRLLALLHSRLPPEASSEPSDPSLPRTDVSETVPFLRPSVSEELLRRREAAARLHQQEGAAPADDALVSPDTRAGEAEVPALQPQSPGIEEENELAPPDTFPPANWPFPAGGELAEVAPVELLAACARTQLSGKLDLSEGPSVRSLFWEEGRLVGATSTSLEERLEGLAYRRGLLTREQNRLLRSEGELSTRRQALRMVERAYIKPGELFSLVQERVAEVAYESCGALRGQYQLVPQRVADEERVVLARSPLAIVTEAIRRKYLVERLVQQLGGPATLLRPSVGISPDLSEYGLSARERRLAESIDGLRNIEELVFENGIEPLAGLQILYALLLGGSVEIAVRGLATALTQESQQQIDLGRVAEKYQQVQCANYFELLGVPRESTAYEIEQAYQRLVQEFRPERFAPLLETGPRVALGDRLEEIQRVLAEARDILGNDGLRAAYRRQLPPS